MSLIIEALKRARDDAVQRQAAAKGLPLAPVPRMRGRSRWLSFAVVPLAAALIICILLLVDLYSRMPDDTTSAVSAPGPSVSSLSDEPDQAAAAPTASAPEAPLTAEVAVVEAPIVKAPVRAPTAAPASPTRSPSHTEADADHTPQPSQPATISAAVESGGSIAPIRAPTRADREFVGQAQLPDGTLIDLEGIAWSESEPFALLNGQVVGVGEVVRAYRVLEIQRDRVILEQSDDRVVLRLD